MKKCWESDPVERPTFSGLVKSIDERAEYLTGYVNLSELIATDTPETYTQNMIFILKIQSCIQILGMSPGDQGLN